MAHAVVLAAVETQVELLERDVISEVGTKVHAAVGVDAVVGEVELVEDIAGFG